MRTLPYEPRGGAGPPAFDGGAALNSNVTRKLLWANGIAFAVTFLLAQFLPIVGEPIWQWLRLDPNTWYGGIPPLWQLWSYGFLHDLESPGHILYNMLGLYFFGRMLEAQVGSRRFAWQYFTALAIGAIVHLALAPALGQNSIADASGAAVPYYPAVVGASGAVLYAVVACAVLQPNAQVLLIFVPVPLKVMAMIFVGMDLFVVLSGKLSRTASDVHLAGAALGFAAARLGWIYFDPNAWWSARKVQRVQDVQASDEQRLDQLLERIHREGIHSLSQRDKDFLSRMSKRS